MALDWKTLKRVLSHYHLMASQVSQGFSDTVPLPDGDEICFFDLLIGFDGLPRRQKEAVFFHVILDIEGETCARILGYESRHGRNLVTNNAIRGLKKMAECHNAGGVDE